MNPPLGGISSGNVAVMCRQLDQDNDARVTLADFQAWASATYPHLTRLDIRAADRRGPYTPAAPYDTPPIPTLLYHQWPMNGTGVLSGSGFTMLGFYMQHVPDSWRVSR